MAAAGASEGHHGAMTITLTDVLLALIFINLLVCTISDDIGFSP
jgi:hypothetical protein